MDFKNKKLKEFEEYIRNRKIAIIGLGVSNLPLIDYFYIKQAKVTLFDSRSLNEIPNDIINKIKNYSMKLCVRKKLFNRITRI